MAEKTSSNGPVVSKSESSNKSSRLSENKFLSEGLLAAADVKLLFPDNSCCFSSNFSLLAASGPFSEGVVLANSTDLLPLALFKTEFLTATSMPPFSAVFPGISLKELTNVLSILLTDSFISAKVLSLNDSQSALDGKICDWNESLLFKIPEFFCNGENKHITGTSSTDLPFSVD